MELRRRERGVESNSGCGETPTRCVFVTVSARQPWRGPDLVESSCWFGVWCYSSTTVIGPALQWLCRHGTVQSASLLVSKDVELYLHVHDLKKMAIWYCGGGGWPCIAAVSLASARLLEGERKCTV